MTSTKLNNSADLLNPEISDVLISNLDNGRIGLSAGIDLPVGAKDVSIYLLNLSPTLFKDLLDKGAMVHVKLGTLAVEIITGAQVVTDTTKKVEEAVADTNPISGGETFGEGSNNVAPTLFPTEPVKEEDSNPIAVAAVEDVKIEPAKKPVPKVTPVKK